MTNEIMYTDKSKEELDIMVASFDALTIDAKKNLFDFLNKQEENERFNLALLEQTILILMM